MSLAEHVTQIREEMQDPLKVPPTEGSTCDRVIFRLLLHAGYSYHEILAQGADAANDCPDYTILPQSPGQTWYLEAKAWHVELKDSHVFQAVKYPNTKGHRWVVLSNGRDWRLYDQHMVGEQPPNRLVASARLACGEELVEFLTALGKDSVVSNGVEKFALQARVTHYLDEQLRSADSEVTKAVVAVVRKKLQGVKSSDVAAYFSGRFSQNRDGAPIPVRQNPTPAVTDGAVKFEKGDSSSPPDLSFTTRLSGHFGTADVSNWNELLHAAIVAGVKNGMGIAELKAALSANLRPGIHTNHGFRPVKGTDVSVQGLEANRAWRDSVILARILGIEVQVAFSWQNCDKVPVARRNTSATLRWAP